MSLHMAFVNMSVLLQEYLLRKSITIYLLHFYKCRIAIVQVQPCYLRIAILLGIVPNLVRMFILIRLVARSRIHFTSNSWIVEFEVQNLLIYMHEVFTASLR